MTLENDKERAKKHAYDLQNTVNAIVGDERDNEELMARFDRMINELVAVAEKWDGVDDDMAARVREQEKQLHGLRAKLARLGELEADEVSRLNVEIVQALKTARGEA